MTRRPPPELVSRTCPACARRVNGQIAGDCPICRGSGKLTLGRPALFKYPPDVVSRAVEVALELQANKDLSAHPVDLAKARDNLTAMVDRLTKVGLLHPGETDPPVVVGGPMRQAQQLAAQASGLDYQPGTELNLLAPAVKYEPGSVPVQGTLPGFSAAGFLCGLARVTDPIDQLRVLTPDSPKREARDHLADVIGRAVVHG